MADYHTRNVEVDELEFSTSTITFQREKIGLNMIEWTLTATDNTPLRCRQSRHDGQWSRRPPILNEATYGRNGQYWLKTSQVYKQQQI